MKWANPWKLLKELERKMEENQELAKRVDDKVRHDDLKKQMVEAAQRFEAT